MELILLDGNMNTLADIDSFNSLIWANRYDEIGDFELRVALNERNLGLFKLNKDEDFFLCYKNEEEIMVVEDINITEDSEMGSEISITGRECVSILDRRCVMLDYDKATIHNTDELVNFINDCFNASFGTYMGKNRKHSNPIIDMNSGVLMEENLYFGTFDIPYVVNRPFGHPLLKLIEEACSFCDVGFHMRVNLEDRPYELFFYLYNGIDLTYGQNARPPVVFSDRFDNKITSEYFSSLRSYKNAGVVRGTDEAKTTVYVELPGVGKHNRREVHIRPQNTQRPDGMSDVDYKALLQTEGLKELKRMKKETKFEGEMDVRRSFRIGSSFNLGDIVVIEDSYGNYSNVRCTEIIRSVTENGYEVFPSFTPIDE